MKITRYSNKDKILWNNFLKISKNSHFMFNRNYMEYHQDRFNDFSLMFKDENEIIKAVFPANISNRILYSHEGLTFGGLCVSKDIKTIEVHKMFCSLIEFSRSNNIKKIIYKRLPDFYTSLSAQEDLYSLFLFNAKLIRRDVTTTIDLSNKISFSKMKNRNINKAIKSGVTIEATKSLSSYWEILEEVLLKKYKISPVHSLKEIEKLKNQFPENIKCFIASKDTKVLAGTLVFETPNVVHTQYLANSEIGKKFKALDLIIYELTSKIFKHKKFFNFGISTEDNGKIINKGLISFKEGFGGGAQTHDFYEIEID